MPYLIGALSALIFTKAGAWVTSILTALGLGFAVQVAILTPVLSHVSSAFGGLPSDLANWMGFLNIDKYVSIVVSAYVGSLAKRVILRKMTA